MGRAPLHITAKARTGNCRRPSSLQSPRSLSLRGTSQEVVAAPAPLEIESVTQQSVMVDVAGAVVNPGVYSLPLNSRVFQAIRVAGGLKKGADASDINQARVLKDGEQIYVYPASSCIWFI